MLQERGKRTLKLKLGKKENLEEYRTVSGGQRPTPPAFSGEAELRCVPLQFVFLIQGAKLMEMLRFVILGLYKIKIILQKVE